MAGEVTPQENQPKLSPEHRAEIAALNADLTALSQGVLEVQEHAVRMRAKCVEVSTRCDDLMTRIIAAHPQAGAVLAPLMDNLRASIAELTGRLQ